MKKKSKVKKVVRKKTKSKIKKVVSKRAVPVGLPLVVNIPEADKFVPMDDDFEADWMVESGKQKGEDWELPRRDAKDVCSGMRACEVELLNGKIIAPCCADMGVYVRVDGEKSIPVEQVKRVKYYIDVVHHEPEEREDLNEYLGSDEMRDILGSENEDEV